MTEKYYVVTESDIIDLLEMYSVGKAKKEDIKEFLPDLKPIELVAEGTVEEDDCAIFLHGGEFGPEYLGEEFIAKHLSKHKGKNIIIYIEEA